MKSRRERQRGNRRALGKGVESPSNWGNQACPFPMEMRVKLRYSSYTTMDPAGGAVENQLISGNSIFDPDATGVGEQPYYFDQLTAIYKNYYVVRSKIKVTCTSTSGVFARVVVLPLLETGSVSTDSYETSEQPFAKSVLISGSSAGPNVQVIHSSMDTHRIIGVSYQQALARTDLHSDYTTNPVYRWYWVVQAQGVGGLTSTLSTVTEYVIVYDVILSGLRTNGDSLDVPLREIRFLKTSGSTKNQKTISAGDPPVPGDTFPQPRQRYHSVLPIASTALSCASCPACSATTVAK